MHLLGFSLCLFVCLFAMCCERVKEKGLVVGRFSQLLRYGGWSTNSCSFWQASTFRSKRCASKTPSSGTSVSCEIHMHVLERISQHTACKMLQFLAEELDNITNVGLGPMVSYCQATRIVHKTKLPEQIGGSQMHLEGFSYSNIPRGTGCHKGGRWTVEDRGGEKIERRWNDAGLFVWYSPNWNEYWIQPS